MLRRLIIIGGYILGAFIIIVGTILLVAYGSGYSYDFKSGRLVHRGLLLLETKPADASITQDGRFLNKKTPYRKSLEGGTYTFMLEKEGYRTWTKELEVIPSRVTAAQYVLLMPQRFEISEVSTHPAIGQFVSSRDRNRIAYTVPSGSEAGVWLLNAGNKQVNRVYSIPTDPTGQPQESVEIMSWADDASRVLIKRTNAAGTAPLVIAANGSDAPVDLNALFQKDVLASRFSKSDSSQLLWSSPEGLRRIDINDRSVSQPLAEGVAVFTDAGNRIFYVSTSTPKPSLWQVDRGGQKRQLVADLPASATYDLSYSTYIDVPQVALTIPDAGQTRLYTDIDDRESQPIVLNTPAAQASFNGDGRFLLLSSPTYVATYDQELRRQYQLPTQTSPISNLSWFDNYHLQYVQDGKAVVAEYDGNYATGLTRVVNLPPFNAPNDKSVYVVAQTSTGTMQIRSIEIRR